MSTKAHMGRDARGPKDAQAAMATKLEKELAAERAAAPQEVDIQRHLFDMAARAEIASAVNKRHALMQRLMARIQVLSDKEFETAYHTLDSMIERFCVTKASSAEPGKGTGARQVLQDAERMAGNVLDNAMDKALERSLQSFTRIQGK